MGWAMVSARRALTRYPISRARRARAAITAAIRRNRARSPWEVRYRTTPTVSPLPLYTGLEKDR